MAKADYFAILASEGMCVGVRKSNRLNSSEKLEEERELLKKKYGRHFGSLCEFVPRVRVERMLDNIQEALK